MTYKRYSFMNSVNSFYSDGDNGCRVVGRKSEFMSESKIWVESCGFFYFRAPFCSLNYAHHVGVKCSDDYFGG